MSIWLDDLGSSLFILSQRLCMYAHSHTGQSLHLYPFLAWLSLFSLWTSICRNQSQYELQSHNVQTDTRLLNMLPLRPVIAILNNVSDVFQCYFIHFNCIIICFYLVYHIINHICKNKCMWAQTNREIRGLKMIRTELQRVTWSWIYKREQIKNKSETETFSSHPSITASVEEQEEDQRRQEGRWRGCKNE